jgi:chromosome segregation ATPase
MNKYRLSIIRIVLTLVAASFVLSGQAAQLYRYKNNDGVVVIEDRIPPEYSGNGYDVISADGSLIQKVPRELSEEELVLRNTDEARLRLREEEAKLQQEWDESLMLRYSSVEDIQAAESRAMRDLSIRISILKSNLSSIKAQIEREQQKAADIERAGGTAPEHQIKNIGVLRLEIEDTEQSIATRQEEINSVRQSFQRDIERFKTLQARVQMRREQSRPAASNKTNY